MTTPIAFAMRLSGKRFLRQRWIETVQAICCAWCRAAARVQAGRVLAGMSKRIRSGLVGAAIADADGLQQAIAATGA